MGLFVVADFLKGLIGPRRKAGTVEIVLAKLVKALSIEGSLKMLKCESVV